MDTELPVRKSPEKKRSEGIYDWVESLVTAVIACILIFLFLFRVVNVDGSSMVPTLHNADKVIVSRLSRNVSRGDIVVLTKVSFADECLVKRVIATEGQTIDIDFDAGIVYVDGEALQEPYIADATHRRLDFSGPVTVPENCVFCMGDNRNNSSDSRRSTIGMIDTRCIIGKVVLRIWPFSRFGTVS